jgi:hypothetical protein
MAEVSFPGDGQDGEQPLPGVPARDETAGAPADAAGAPAESDDDWDQDAEMAGITCQCDLGPVCRRHHRAKQAPGWHLSQPQPGVMRWTTPSGRVYTTRPTAYDM